MGYSKTNKKNEMGVGKKVEEEKQTTEMKKKIKKKGTIIFRD